MEVVRSSSSVETHTPVRKTAALDFPDEIRTFYAIFVTETLLFCGTSVSGGWCIGKGLSYNYHILTTASVSFNSLLKRQHIQTASHTVYCVNCVHMK